MIRRNLALGFLLWTLAALPAVAEDVRIAVISDLNGSYGSTEYARDVHRAVDAIIALAPDLVLSTGDMVAGQRRPALSEAEVRAMWRGFHAAVTDPLADAGIPLAVTPGNHDGSGYAGFEAERRIYAEEWRARRPYGHLSCTSIEQELEARFAPLDPTDVSSQVRSDSIRRSLQNHDPALDRTSWPRSNFSLASGDIIEMVKGR